MRRFLDTGVPTVSSLALTTSGVNAGGAGSGCFPMAAVAGAESTATDELVMVGVLAAGAAGCFGSCVLTSSVRGSVVAFEAAGEEALLSDFLLSTDFVSVAWDGTPSLAATGCLDCSISCR
uniref:Uncharacterized protein n=1 Tax=Anopheles albimanus TaxID=7167 RepID=A0A182FTM4_ANOAL